MRALRAIGVALVNAVAGCFLGVLAGDYIAQLLHVSNFEGGRGYMVAFVCAPVGIILGGLIGLIVALCFRRTGFIGFLIAEGFALLIGCVAAIVIAGLFFVGVEKPPSIDGKSLALDFELRFPPAIPWPEGDTHNITATLFSDEKDNRFAELDFNRMQKSADAVIIPGSIPLISRSSNRQLLASAGEEFTKTEVFNLTLPKSPTKENLAWSEWSPAMQYVDLKEVPEAERMQLRYRVRLQQPNESGQ